MRTYPELLPFEADPPDDVHFACGRCSREGRVRRAELFSHTPAAVYAGTGHAFDGRCLQCARPFKGALLEYDFGRRILWAKFRMEAVMSVMES